ncbi:MAG: tRNA 5-methoxyuridine(34)/uridine 5-oxyacetic acid(34) synthase CmoB [Helicobacteraceae bacterium]
MPKLQLDLVLKERERILRKNYGALLEQINAIDTPCRVEYKDAITISADLSAGGAAGLGRDLGADTSSDLSKDLNRGQGGDLSKDLSPRPAPNYEDLALALKPWRKGPFSVFSCYIDSEWNSSIKFDIIKDYLDVRGKRVIDIGCNNGYYLFRMLGYSARSLTGFDPSLNAYLQFLFIDRFVHSGIDYKLLGVEHLDEFGAKFDVLLFLGVLYHRSDPIAALKTLRRAMASGAYAILDCLIIEGEGETCLCPARSYAKMKNVYFIPTLATLKNWLLRAGFTQITHIKTLKTSTGEQRKTRWIDSLSLEDFLDPHDESKTVEGYNAPVRVYLKVS